MEHIRNINLGEKITEFFVVRKVEVRRHDDKPYLSMELGCARGRIHATYWGEDTPDFAAALTEGDVVKVQGHGTDYKGQRWLKVEKMRKAKPGEVAPEALLPQGRYSTKILWGRLKKVIESVKHAEMGQLLRTIFEKDRDFAKKFATFPAAKLWHGAHTGGLIEHTLRVTKLCETASTFYPDCRRDLLVTGALLHDIGKVEEISTEGFFDYSARGRLIGHIVIGATAVSRAIREIGKFPPQIEDELLHIILAHHGTMEMGSPVEPKTLEAMILHHADMLDAQSDGVQHIIERDLPRGEQFSEYVKILGRFIYLSGYRNEQ